MAIDLELWWLRSLSFIILVPFLGSYLVSIGLMVKDLAFFILIILIVMIGYGVASRSMVSYPVVSNSTIEANYSIDTSFDGRLMLYQVFYPVYYFLYGDFDEELENLDRFPDARWSIASHILLAVHLILLNILLTNLLIAIFTKRFEQVYTDAQNVWHSQKYVLTREYFVRSPFLPPISLLCDIATLSRMFYSWTMRKYFDKSVYHYGRVFKMIPTKRDTIKEWNYFEYVFTSEFANDQVKSVSTK
ncbi:unnamed protein product [Rotaria sp. Silwood2]|nr:unnamed protein product [Rotaria sp. Silwood2]CAF4392995.1 unnamed protein product [Rotaria sp. Silwood2]